MRILHINKFLYLRGGAERYMFDWAEGARARGHDVFFFGTAHPANVVRDHECFYPPYVEFAGPRVRWRDAVNAIWSRRVGEALASFISYVKPDVAHLHNIGYHLTPAVVAVLARARVPSVMSLHDYNLLCPNHYFYSRREVCTRCVDGNYLACVTRKCVKGRLGPSVVGYLAHFVARRSAVYRRVGRFIVFTRWLEGLMVRAGWESGRVTYMRPALNIPAIPARPKEDYFLYAGRLAPEKGVDTLITAAGRAGSAVRVKVAGDGPMADMLRRQAGRETPGNVTFLGRLTEEDLYPIIASARALVVPSTWPENVPATILNALAAGTAVVGTALGGIPEMVADGAEGVLFPAGDGVKLSEILTRLAEDDDIVVRLGEAARARFVRDFNFHVFMTQLLNIYEEAKASR